MDKQEVWRGLVGIVMGGVILGGLNVSFYALVMNRFTSTEDEVAINTYVLNLFVGWVFFSAWLLMRADEEWKEVAKAVAKKDRDAFILEAPKRMPLSVRLLYLVISFLVVLSFHLFHIESVLALVEIQFGVGFIVAITLQVLWDLDDPLGGVINVSNVPEDWKEQLKLGKEQEMTQSGRISSPEEAETRLREWLGEEANTAPIRFVRTGRTRGMAYWHFTTLKRDTYRVCEDGFVLLMPKKPIRRGKMEGVTVHS